MKYLCSRGKWPAGAAPREGRLARANDLGLCPSCPGKPISISSATEVGGAEGEKVEGRDLRALCGLKPRVARLALARPQIQERLAFPEAL